MWWGEVVRNGREVPSQCAEALCQQWARKQWCVISLYRKCKFLLVSTMAFYEHL